MTTATGLRRTHPESKPHGCASDISTATRPPALPPMTGGGMAATRGVAGGEITVGPGVSGRSHVQSPLLNLVRTCEAEGCGRRLEARHRRFCPAHRNRFYHHGDVLADVPVAPRTRRRPHVRLADTDADPMAVDRAAIGDRSLQLSRPEMAEVVARLTDASLSAARIGEVLGVTERTVQRWRARNRAAS